MKNINKKAFTFVELIIVITILAILTTIWFTSYIWYIADSRDSQRKSDLAQIWSALKVYKQKRGYYSLPGEKSDIVYDNSNSLAYLGKFDTNVRLNTLDRLVMDPKTNEPYMYSIVTNKQEYEMAATLENEWREIALVNWTYKSVSVNILPSLLIATWATEWSSLEIKEWTTAGDENRKLFIYNNQSHNLAYTFIKPYNPTNDWTSFTWLLDEVVSSNSYWQNTDFRNCTEIEESWKLLIPLSATPFEYQIITETWSLTNTWCTL